MPGSPLKKGTVPPGNVDLPRRVRSLERDSPLFQQAAGSAGFSRTQRSIIRRSAGFRTVPWSLPAGSFFRGLSFFTGRVWLFVPRSTKVDVHRAQFPSGCRLKEYGCRLSISKFQNRSATRPLPGISADVRPVGVARSDSGDIRSVRPGYSAGRELSFHVLGRHHRHSGARDRSSCAPPQRSAVVDTVIANKPTPIFHLSITDAWRVRRLRIDLGPPVRRGDVRRRHKSIAACAAGSCSCCACRNATGAR